MNPDPDTVSVTSVDVSQTKDIVHKEDVHLSKDDIEKSNTDLDDDSETAVHHRTKSISEQLSKVCSMFSLIPFEEFFHISLEVPSHVSMHVV